jgi:hypothetical protein
MSSEVDLCAYQGERLCGEKRDYPLYRTWSYATLQLRLLASDFSALTGYVTTGLGQDQVLEGVSHDSEKNYMDHFNVGM